MKKVRLGICSKTRKAVRPEFCEKYCMLRNNNDNIGCFLMAVTELQPFADIDRETMKALSAFNRDVEQRLALNFPISCKELKTINDRLITCIIRKQNRK